jgi:predicted flap endonuclease-1-like 5' DNA nuclease
MRLFEKLKSLLGLGGSETSADEPRSVDVTVEHHPGRPDASTERAVKEPGGERERSAAVGATPSDDEEDDEPRVPSEAVDVIKGIGPTYAGRLADAGVETVDDLAAADAADLAGRADVPQGRAENWIERANARSR